MNMNRRMFIQRGSVSLLAASAAFSIAPSRLLGTDAPSRKIAMGMIGVGGMGSGNMGGFLGIKDVVIRAVCDPNTKKTDAAKGAVDRHNGNKDCATYADFREMIARGDLDAVMIAMLKERKR